MNEAGPLSGIRVLDFTQGIAGAITTLQLADAGADVVVVEPTAGSALRSIDGVGPGAQSLHDMLQRDKRSLAIDHGDDAARDPIERLVSGADVILEDARLRGGTLPDNLLYESVSPKNGSLVYCSISAFGDEGPSADALATELELQGLTGHMWFLSEQGAPPVRVGADIAEYAGAQHAFLGVTSALLWRADSGRGQRVSVPLAAALLSVGSHWMADFSDPDDFTGGVTHPYEIPETGYRTKDKQVMFGFLGRRPEKREPWQEFCRRLGLEALLEDPWMAEHGAGLVGVGKDAQETKPILEEAMLKLTSDEFVELINDVGGRVAPFMSYDELYGDPPHPEPTAWGTIRSIDDTRVILSPWANVDGIGRREHRGAPRLGQHSRDVLEEAGVSANLIASLVERNVVLTSPGSGDGIARSD